MKYQFVAAHCVYGMAMRPGQGNVTIYRDGAAHVFLTSDATARKPNCVHLWQRAIPATASVCTPHSCDCKNADSLLQN
jgi:hypothetical protein